MLATLASLGLARGTCDDAWARACGNGTDIGLELVSAGAVSEEMLAAAIGLALGIAAEAIAETASIVDCEGPGAGPPFWEMELCRTVRTLRVCTPCLEARLFMAPRIEDLDAVLRLIDAHPGRRSILRVTTLRALQRHRASTSLMQRAEIARFGLSACHPHLSARQVWTGQQGMVAGVLISGLSALAVLAPWLLLHLLHLAMLPLFLACAVARLQAARRLLSSRRTHGGFTVGPPGASATRRPVYSVLVALHDEKEMAGELVAALSALQWPTSRLEVMLVCEGDDAGTIAAVAAAIAGRPQFAIVLVPPSLPRTKPKALNVALPLATGEFLVIYDAEDRPRPDQLEAAFQRFCASEPRLACLQAPLIVRNGASSWLSGHFALEYAALFRGYLPWLSSVGLPLPLGGTSNHFRRDALKAVGGWDSHNVTEDADLGIRLCRAGYRIETIDVPTFEDAPERFIDWRNQRTRWMKGWLQTWLVHMRDPVGLWRDLGAKGFFGFQLLFFGMLTSAVAHAFLLAFLAYTAYVVWSAGSPDMLTQGLLAADVFALVAGYVAFVILATRALDEEEAAALPRHLWTLPAYWLLISLAAFRAFRQLKSDPHAWEKTPHYASRSPAIPAMAAAAVSVTARLDAIADQDNAGSGPAHDMAGSVLRPSAATPIHL